jgi:hypothetical protein
MMVVNQNRNFDPVGKLTLNVQILESLKWRRHTGARMKNESDNNPFGSTAAPL